MNCPVCDHEARHLGGGGDEIYHWCPNCGALVANSLGGSYQWTPNLVEQCREYERKVWTGSPANYWNTLGIANTIGSSKEKKDGK